MCCPYARPHVHICRSLPEMCIYVVMHVCVRCNVYMYVFILLCVYVYMIYDRAVSLFRASYSTVCQSRAHFPGMYIYVCLYICIYIRMCMYVYVSLCICKFMYMYVYVYVCRNSRSKIMVWSICTIIHLLCSYVRGGNLDTSSLH